MTNLRKQTPTENTNILMENARLFQQYPHRILQSILGKSQTGKIASVTPANDNSSKKINDQSRSKLVCTSYQTAATKMWWLP